MTTIRSLGDVRYEVAAVRDEVVAGRRQGPRLLASGPLLAVSGGHGTPTIALVSDNPWDARRNVRINLRNGVDVIKIAATGGVTDARAIGEAGRPQMTEEEMAAICEEAHQSGIIVAAHAESLAGCGRRCALVSTPSSTAVRWTVRSSISSWTTLARCVATRRWSRR